MPIIYTIFRKELRDTLRDHRTILTMLVIPLLVIPLAVNFMGRMDMSGDNGYDYMRVVFVAEQSAHELEWRFRGDERFLVLRTQSEENARQMLIDNEADVALVVEPGFHGRVSNGSSGAISVLFSHMQSPEKRRIIHQELRGYEAEVLASRFERLDAPATYASAINFREHDVTRPEEVLGRMMGGLMPYILIIFCFLGCMYPALDLGAGEKERGTMETLLTAPASRLQIVIGKFGVVVLAGITSASIAMLGMYLGMIPHAAATTELIATMQRFFEPSNVVVTMALVVPLTMFFGAILLAVSIYARSFKEAQSIITPLTIVAIFPAGVALVPSIELGMTTAFIPVLNVSLAAKGMAMGSLPVLPTFIVFGSLMLLAATALYACSLYFHRESVIFRS
jgi:sodium transport system permease protein